MPTVAELAAPRSTYERQVARRLEVTLARLWGGLADGDFDALWQRDVGRRVLASVVAAQMLAASGATEYVGTALEAQSVDPGFVGELAPETFAGYAADGRTLDGALYLPVTTTKRQIAEGRDVPTALEAGLARLLLIALGEVGNSARLADGSAIALSTGATGYVRQVNLPSCGRCIVLAGKFYSKSDGFRRHPRCDCLHVPATANLQPQSPTKLLSRMTAEERAAALGKGNAAAVDAGADLGSVVNAGNGTSVPGVTRAARAGRPTPAQLLDQYGDDPVRFRAALEEAGYVVR